MEKAVISSGAAGFLAASASNLSAAPLGLPIGSQVWPTRSMIKDFPAYVKMMADIGVTRLELCSPVGYGAEFSSLANGKEVARILADHGMKSESSHFTMEELRKTQQKSIDWAKEVGITQIITATLGGGNNPTLDQVKKAADEYNKIAAVSAAAGLQQGLHNEGFELSMVDGKRTYDLLLELLDPKLVRYQFQMSTITAGDLPLKTTCRLTSQPIEPSGLGGVPGISLTIRRTPVKSPSLTVFISNPVAFGSGCAAKTVSMPTKSFALSSLFFIPKSNATKQRPDGALLK